MAMLWNTIAEESNCTMDCNISNSAINGNNNGSNSSTTRRALRLSTADEMPMDAMDELSFYDDDLHTPQTDLVTSASPELHHLLSPEGSPQRFQIIKRNDHQISHNSNNNNNNLIGGGIGGALIHETPSRGFRVFNSLSSAESMESSMDDEYMELFEMESQAQLQQQQQQQQQSSSLLSSSSSSIGRFVFPSGLNSLISGQIKVNSPTTPQQQQQQQHPTTTPMSMMMTPDSSSVSASSLTMAMRRPPVRRCLSMTETNSNYQLPAAAAAALAQPKTPELLLKETARDCFKRPEPPTSTTCSPIQMKRQRNAEKENQPTNHHHYTNNNNSSSSGSTTTSAPPPLRKCMSLNDAEIMSALARSENLNEPELIGDFSKAYALPLIQGRHRDLKSISSETVSRLLRGEFDNDVGSYRIIDCRYPYEYEGGHIAGALNLYTHEQILEEFLTAQQTELQRQQNAKSGLKRNIIIFHCEFSSERGPKMSRFLRNLDRERNTNMYPALHYPEIYLLHNGYKEFYETHAELCEPHAYRPMLEPAYNEAYRHFRAKSKSWTGGESLAGATGRLKKSRSRLLL